MLTDAAQIQWRRALDRAGARKGCRRGSRWRASSGRGGHGSTNNAPLGRVAQSAAAARQRAGPVRAPAARTVLVADDKSETRETVAFWLQHAGFSVVEAADGA